MSAMLRTTLCAAQAGCAAAASARRAFHVSSAIHAPLRASVALLQPKPPAGGKKPAGGPAAPAVEEKFDLKKQIPVNLLKEGGEPEYKEDSAYPPWVFKLLEEKPLLEDMVMKGIENVPTEQMQTVFRMANKRRIKERNTGSAKNA